MASALADAAGARVALVARSEDDLAEIAADLEHDPLPIPADLAEPDAPTAIAAAALGGCGRFDILVNNAAMACAWTRPTWTAPRSTRCSSSTSAPRSCCPAALLPSMVARRRGSIINITSISGVVGAPRRAAYTASKGGMDAATRALAMEYGPHGIRVNAVAPGVVETDMWTAPLAQPRSPREEVTALTALRRLSTPDDVADVVVFLASDAARYLTGETLSADGGREATLDLYGGAV